MSRIAALCSNRGTACPSVTSSIIASLKRLGHELLELDMDLVAGEHHEDLEKTKDLIRLFAPDFAFSYGLCRGSLLFPDGRFFLRDMGIPYVSFFFDNPFWYLQECGRECADALRDWDQYRVFVSDKAYVDMMKAQGFSRCEYLPLAADPRVFDAGAKPHAEAFDISFVGSLQGTPAQLKAKRTGRWRRFPAFNRVIDELVDMAPDSRAIGRRLLDTMGMPLDIHAVFTRTVCEEASTLSRLRICAGLGLPVHVFGDPVWRDLAWENTVYEGTVNYGEELCSLYRATRINLNITSPQIPTGLTQRVFDAACCGAFLITDAREDLRRMFGDTVVSYSNEKDLKEKAAYYLKRGFEREQMARAARDIVLRGNTWDDRCRQALDCLGFDAQTAGEAYADA